MKILLINPPYTRLRGSGQGAFFPLGLGYLAGPLADDGFEPRIYSVENVGPGEPLPKMGMREVFELRSQGHANYTAALANADHHVWKEVRETLDAEQPDLVGVTALSVQFGAAAVIARLVKTWRADCPVVFGGHHATYMPADSLMRVPDFDVVVMGEGEETFLELCQAHRDAGRPLTLNDYRAIRGLAYRSPDGAILFTEPRPPIQNLDALPHPRRDLALYPERFAPDHFATLIYGRGCPWACRFCSSQVFWGRRTRYRAADDCLDEIAALQRDYGLTHFMFWDDAFSVKRSNVLDFCNKTTARGLRFTFATATRANLVDDETLAALRRAGCVELFLGVESGSPAMLEYMKKDLDLEELRQAAARIKAHDLALGCFFMAGFPKETREDLEQTFALVREMDDARIAFNVFDPMPGSCLYDECVALGVVGADEDWRDFPLWPDRRFVTAMSPTEFDHLATAIAEYIFKRNESFSGKLRRALPLLRRNPKAFFRKAARAAKRAAGRETPEMLVPPNPTHK